VHREAQQGVADGAADEPDGTARDLPDSRKE